VATTTFLFTDIEGSTRLWEAHPEAMKVALAAHDEITTKHVDANGGRVFKHMGDGAIAVFGSAADAIDAAKAIQAALADTTHPDVGTLRVRMGIHSGEVEERDGDYFGPTLNRAARLMSAGHGGQVLVSLVAERLAGNRSDLEDLGEHRLRDLGKPERIFQVSSATEFPKLRTLDIAPNNLPVFATSFIGRENELEELAKLVRGARLVTVTGVGGAGKTRLSLQAAAELADGFPDGVWLVELGAVTDPDLVDAAFAEGLSIGQEEGKSLRDSVVDSLRVKEALLIVDNCEHLVDATAGFVDAVLSSAPDVKVLTTSRELLSVPGEVAYGLRSMALPGPGEPVDARTIGRYDAVRLFTERAIAAKPDFAVDADSAPAVVEICHRLDGMPLALELAASRLRTFSPAKVAELLDQRFRLLTGGSRTALPRQQTLEATIEWSYRLLDDREQALLRRLSAFQGGFTYEAVAAVAAVDPIDELDILELLPSLVDKSLVVADERDGDTRYRLLETIRQFARNLFEDSDEADTIRLAHARHFESLATEAAKHIRGPDEAAWWARIDAELDNLRLAMTWSVENGHGDLALSTATGFWRFWWFKGRWLEGARWLEAALDSSGDDVDDLLLARGLLGYGSLVEFSTARVVESLGLRRSPVESLDRSIELFASLHEAGIDPSLLHEGYAAALINRGVLHELRGEDDEVTALMERALDVSRAIGDITGITVALGNLAQGAVEAGDLDEALRLHDEAIAVSEQIGSNVRLGDAWSQRAQLVLRAGDLRAAGEAMQKARSYAAAAELPHYVDFYDVVLAMNDYLLGEGSAQTIRDRLAVVVRHEAIAQSAGFLPDLLAATLLADEAEGRLEHAATVIGAFRAAETGNDHLIVVIPPVIERVRARLPADEFERLADLGNRLQPIEAAALLTN
jgi:predicted ATPase/class 3 adenylate cyclase